MKALMVSTFLVICAAVTTTNAQELMSAPTETQAPMMPGQFVSVGGHQVTGSARIENRFDGLYLVLDDNFTSSEGPDLRLVLRDSSGANMMIFVAPLQKYQGAQIYKLNTDEQTAARYDMVSIYCAKFHVDFGIANLH